MRSSDGARFKCTLIISSAKDGDGHVAFVTNCNKDSYTQETLSALPEEYRKRWRIETGYRDAKRVMPRTTSRNDAIRLALFYISLILSNIWMLARAGSSVPVRLVVWLASLLRLDNLDVWPYRPPPSPG